MIISVRDWFHSSLRNDVTNKKIFVENTVFIKNCQVLAAELII